MTEKEKVDILKQIDFGDIDANADPNLENYFIDNNYWNRIVEKTTYFVVGKKGTGKSAIYQYLYQLAIANGTLISNKDFGEFPFEKLMLLSDDSFSKPNQYQSIWHHVIINILIELIIRNEGADKNKYYKQLKDYYDICIGDVVNLHKDTITKVKKTGVSLVLSKIGISPSIAQENELVHQLGSGDTNISLINSNLISLIENYLITRDDNTPYLIQFDRLDDSYNQYADVETYYNVISSLLKTVYNLNNKLRLKKINNVKIIVYLRSDIINEICKRDSESARWDDYTYKINWSIINKDDWNNPLLLQMLNKRIQNSVGPNVDFYDIFDKDAVNLKLYNLITKKLGRYKMDVFRYIVNPTFHRPRDIIQFCKKIQEETEDFENCEKITSTIIKNAEKKFAFWLVSKELANEINPIYNVDDVYELLRGMGSKPFKYGYFIECIKKSELCKKDNPEKIIEYLYDTGLIMNVNKDINGKLIYRSIIRNESKVNTRMMLKLHPGVWKGLNV